MREKERVMEITKRKPSGLPAFRRQFDELFESFFGNEPTIFQNGDWLPALDEIETPSEIVVKAELPGIEEKDISITLSGDQLLIHGEKKAEKEEKDKHFRRFERSYGRFERMLTLPPSIDPEKISAAYTNGVLEVHLPKRPEAKPKAIKVSAK
jgi:HSP20 family protein